MKTKIFSYRWNKKYSYNATSKLFFPDRRSIDTELLNFAEGSNLKTVFRWRSLLVKMRVGQNLNGFNLKSLKKSFSKQYCLLSFLLTVLTIQSSLSGPSSLSGGELLTDGNYHPGTVLIWQDAQWQQATPDNVSPNKSTFVFIHGAHNSKKENSDVLTETIQHLQPNANVLAIDWAYWSSFSPNKLEGIIQEEVQKWLAELLLTLLSDRIFDTQSDYNAIVNRHIQNLFQNILVNIMPLEQSKYIPTVSKRVELILFGDRSKDCAITTDNEEHSIPCLGLQPEKTHLIGHSHGSHIAGLIGMYTQKDGYGTVKKITALDPSAPFTQISSENKEGNGWNNSAAKYVEVIRASLICSSDKLYGDSNIQFDYKEHPAYQLDSVDFQEQSEAIPILIDTLVTDIRLHARTVDLYAKIIEQYPEILDTASPPEDASPNEWNVHEY